MKTYVIKKLIKIIPYFEFSKVSVSVKIAIRGNNELKVSNSRI